MKLIQDELNSVHSSVQIIKVKSVIKIGLGQWGKKLDLWNFEVGGMGEYWKQ